MGVERIVTKPGNGADFPKKHDKICVDYTGWLYDEEAPGNKGTQFDTSLERGVLTTVIGAGRVIKGWDEGILGSEDVPPMSLGEVATLKITPDYAYGSRGFLGHIPADATLIFEVELKAINGKGE